MNLLRSRYRFATAFLVTSLTAGSFADETVVPRDDYIDRLQGFWLAQSIANWTGLVTEMARVEAPFYTDDDWGRVADRSIWGHFPPHASVIDFYLVEEGRVWGADDDTDIEYLYLHLLDQHGVAVLSADQIREGWLRHLYSNDDAPPSPVSGARENYLWVSNEAAYDLMRERGLRPPATSDPANNPLSDMIDAQLTTELFGLLAPTRPDVALEMARLPIRTTAHGEAAQIAEFYVVMHALAATRPLGEPLGDHLRRTADAARRRLPDDAYPAKMYDFVKAAYVANPDRDDWEATRDAVYRRYQVEGRDGYAYKQPFDGGINFAASLVSLFYGDGDLKRTIRIGALCGWDSDNPTATWGGLIGFLIGKRGVGEVFGREDFSDAYWIHRTRRGFPDYTPNAAGEDTFRLMAERGARVIDRVVVEQMGGQADLERGRWVIPTR